MTYLSQPELKASACARCFLPIEAPGLQLQPAPPYSTRQPKACSSFEDGECSLSGPQWQRHPRWGVPGGYLGNFPVERHRAVLEMQIRPDRADQALAGIPHQ